MTQKVLKRDVVSYVHDMHPVHVTASGLAKVIGVNHFGDAPLAAEFESRWKMFDNASFVKAFDNGVGRPIACTKAVDRVFPASRGLLQHARQVGSTSDGIQAVRAAAGELQKQVQVLSQLALLPGLRTTESETDTSTDDDASESDIEDAASESETDTTTDGGTSESEADPSTDEDDSESDIEIVTLFEADDQASPTDAALVDEATKRLVEEIDRHVITSYGVSQESSAIQQYETMTGIKVTGVDETKTKEVLPSVYVAGRVDGMQDGAVVEVKNRTNRLFTRVYPYENVQVQAYMQMFDVEEAIMVECLRRGVDDCDINIINIRRDDGWWQQEVLPKLAAFASLYRDVVLHHEAAARYASLDKLEREMWLRSQIVGSR